MVQVNFTPSIVFYQQNISFESIVIQSLEAYVLPMLPAAPLFIHKMQFKLKIDPACYRELDLQIGKGNGGKEHVEIIGRVRVSYRFYSGL
jgi:hypothetical protein